MAGKLPQEEEFVWVAKGLELLEYIFAGVQ